MGVGVYGAGVAELICRLVKYTINQVSLPLKWPQMPLNELVIRKFFASGGRGDTPLDPTLAPTALGGRLRRVGVCSGFFFICA